MLNREQMKQRIKEEDYCLCIYEEDEQVWLLKHRGEVRITPQRAIEWVEAGIEDLDCRSKETMLEVLNDLVKRKEASK